MVDPNQSPTYLGAAQIIDGEVCAALVLVFQPAEALGFARFFVADQLEEDGLAELREDGDDVSFRELVRQAAEVDVGCVAVVDVP